ncbi:hypothetical protein FA15DRAFT_672471 [Coprinopsis marcescibilis]|uniref:F-box domain-containing protein n=1 Tax=Coprinopsis marcescibilis TaxID=230819 RepID=A0A5C3KND1_COPMA|nr:hypothetical protein FA15DRAFT_672471 [Coprinopsis marcescibilis]
MPARLAQKTIPDEVLELIAFLLVASEPLDNLADLVPFLRASREVYGVLSLQSGTVLYSRICRLKFDCGAVARRAFQPFSRDLADHLVQMCQLLQFIRRGDEWHEDAQDYLLLAFIAMLDDDGKNRAQLEHVGLREFVDKFVRGRLNEGREANDMWPIENDANTCALWLMWMFTTQEDLERESIERKQEIIRLVSPFVVCPYRYASAYAPANHFQLPLGESNPIQKDVVTFPTAHGTYPIYHTQRKGGVVLHYFRSNAPVVLPPITAAAKKLYWCRHEITPFFVIPSQNDLLTGAPVNPNTLQDVAALNNSKAAKLPNNVQWDWVAGCPRIRSGVLLPTDHTESQRWDMDWWRMRMCRDVFYKQPSWRLGHVFVRGMLSGIWHGVCFHVEHNFMDMLLNNSQLLDDQSAIPAHLMPQPLVMDLQEHGYVGSSLPSRPTALSNQPNADLAPIPPAEPHSVACVVNYGSHYGQATVRVDGSLPNAWFPGPIGSLRWTSGPQLDAGSTIRESLPRNSTFRGKDAMDSVLLRTPANRSRELGEGSSLPLHSHCYETFAVDKEAVHERLVRAKLDVMYHRPTASSPSFQPHPGCLRCADRERFLSARKLRDQRIRYGEMAEDVFSSIGMGMADVPDGDEDEELSGRVIDIELDSSSSGSDGDMQSKSSSILDCGEGSGDTGNAAGCGGGEVVDVWDEHVDLEQGSPGRLDELGNIVYEPLRRSHDRYRVETCNYGVEDTIVTGRTEASDWDYSIYYGRVRPWDGLVAVLKQQILGERIASMIFYGYIYGSETFVGNWRYAGTDPLRPGFESCFILSKRKS